MSNYKISKVEGLMGNHVPYFRDKQLLLKNLIYMINIDILIDI